MEQVRESRIKNWISLNVGKLQYLFSKRRPTFPCKVEGEKPNPKDQYNTIIVCRFTGKRDTFDIPIKDLLANRLLVERFSPTDAVKIGVIAMGDILSSQAEGTENQRYLEIKSKMLSLI